MQERRVVGMVAHYYGRIGVAVVELSDELKVGDEVIILGKATELKQKVESMQIQHKPVEVAKAGQSIGLKVVSKVREGDIVYKLQPSS